MARTSFAVRAEELETGIVQAFAELDKADGSRIGLQEAIDASQAIMREAYGDTLDEDALNFTEEDSEDYDDESDNEQDFVEQSDEDEDEDEDE